MILFEHDSKSAAFWFAAEEYIVRFLRPDKPVLMLWSTDDTIMIGANQVTEAECDLAYAKSSGIEVVRRSSGGGAIFTDRGALQVSVICPYETNDDMKTVVQENLAEPVIEALGRCGASASFEGRNDIMIEGKKVSGVAQYVKEGYIVSHCSLLFSTDLEKLEKCLKVDREKIATKAIASVRSRVINITDFIAVQDIVNFRTILLVSYSELIKASRGVEYKKFPDSDADAICVIMHKKYMNPEWTFGREPAFTFTNKKRFPGGRIEVFLDVKGGIIHDAHINGDFLSLLPVTELEAQLVGLPHRADALAEALNTIDVEAYLGSLGASELLDVMQ